MFTQWRIGTRLAAGHGEMFAIFAVVAAFALWQCSRNEDAATAKRARPAAAPVAKPSPARTGTDDQWSAC